MNAYRDVQVELAEALRPYAEIAVNRLAYLFKDVSFIIDGACVRARVPNSQNAAEITREISYAVYREKIYAETLPMRKSFYDAVTRS